MREFSSIDARPDVDDGAMRPGLAAILTCLVIAASPRMGLAQPSYPVPLPTLVDLREPLPVEEAPPPVLAAEEPHPAATFGTPGTSHWLAVLMPA